MRFSIISTSAVLATGALVSGQRVIPTPPAMSLSLTESSNSAQPSESAPLRAGQDPSTPNESSTSTITTSYIPVASIWGPGPVLLSDFPNLPIETLTSASTEPSIVPDHHWGHGPVVIPNSKDLTFEIPSSTHVQARHVSAPQSEPLAALPSTFETSTSAFEASSSSSSSSSSVITIPPPGLVHYKPVPTLIHEEVPSRRRQQAFPEDFPPLPREALKELSSGYRGPPLPTEAFEGPHGRADASESKRGDPDGYFSAPADYTVEWAKYDEDMSLPSGFCTAACRTWFMLEFDRSRPTYMEREDDHMATPHFMMYAGGRATHPAADTTDAYPDTGPGYIMRWGELKCPKRDDAHWERWGGDWEKIDMESLRQNGTRPGIPQWLWVHGGNYCKSDDATDEETLYNLWIWFDQGPINIAWHAADDGWTYGDRAHCWMDPESRTTLLPTPWRGWCQFPSPFKTSLNGDDTPPA